MATDRANNNRESSRSQESRYVPTPGNVVLLHDLEEIRAIWGASADRVYRAVARGLLHAYGRPGRQKYYAERELIIAFGEPSRGPSNDPAKLSASDNGRNQGSFEFETSRAA